MKGALWTWYEGASGGTTPRFACGDHPTCGEWSPEVNYCDKYKYKYDMPCSPRTNGSGGMITYAGRGAIQLSWNYNYGMFARFLYSLGIRDEETGGYLDLINYPNKVITHMNPPLSIMGSMWFYMTAANGYPSMHSAIIGNWKGHGKWQGAVFGPTSKIINNECGGESKTEGEIGGYESRRIKAFRFYTSFFGTPVMADGEDESTLSCSGLDFQDKNALKSYDYDWSGKCNCKPVKWAGIFRYADTSSGGQSAIDAEFNNAWNKKWCEELLRKNKGFGSHYGMVECT
jgi:hypothetical protein